MPPPFVPFTATHGGAIAAGIAAVAMLILLGRTGPRNERIARFILALLCLSAFGYSQAAWMGVDAGPDLDSSLPLHLCDIAAITGSASGLLLQKHVVVMAAADLSPGWPQLWACLQPAAQPSQLQG
jgi:uncharacterized membrane protein YwaF